MCVLGGGVREPAVGPLTSFQSLPFINIYSISSTKNNILEPREEKKINAKHRELGLQIMCQSGMEPRARERLREHRARGTAPPAVLGQAAGPWLCCTGPSCCCCCCCCWKNRPGLQRRAHGSPFPPRLLSGIGAGGSLTQCERKEGGYF